MKLSIITVCYNNLDGLKRTYHSIIEQTSRNDFEWIVIDGASTDGTQKWLREHDNEIDIWISEPDTGIFNAMNKGIHISSGDYLLFMNAGDPLNGQNIIEECLPLLDGTDLIYGEQRTFDPVKNKLGYFTAPSPFRPVDFIYKTLPHQATFIRAELHKKDSYREDVGIMGDFIFFAEQVILHNASQKKIPLSAGIFYTDGISMRDFSGMMKQREEMFIKCFSQPLYDDLKKLVEFENLPLIGLNRKALKIRHYLGTIKRSILR